MRPAHTVWRQSSPESWRNGLLRALLPREIAMSAASGLTPRGRACALIAHQPHVSPGRVRIPSLLAVHGHAVPQLRFSDVVALEMDFIGRVVRVVDDPEIGELIRSLRRNFGGLACGGVEPGLRTIERHGVEIVESRDSQVRRSQRRRAWPAKRARSNSRPLHPAPAAH